MTVFFTEYWSEGDVMPEWQQHMTVFPWANGALDVFERRLGQQLAGFNPVSIEISGQTEFGETNKVPVYLLEPTSILGSIHRAALQALEGCATLENDEHTGYEYIPHITPKPGQPALQIGETFLLSQLTIVQKVTKTRFVYKHVRLHDENTS